METLAIIPGLQGHFEVLIIIFIILLLFGAKKLPELSRSLGKSLGEFKKGQREGDKPELDDAEFDAKEITDADDTEKSE